MNLVPLRRHYSGQSVSPRESRGGSVFSDFDRLFDNMFNNALTNLSAPAPSVGDLALRIDVSETDKAYIVTADVPGMAEEDVDLTVTDGILTISGEKQAEAEEEGKTYHRFERSYGAFRRSMQLPQDADEEKISASMKNGVLTVEISKAKTPEKKTKSIKIKS